MTNRGRPSRAGPRKSTEAEKPRAIGFPRWIVAAALVAGALLTYVAQRNGPGIAWQELREALGYLHPPKIVGLAPVSANSMSFVVSVENPNLQRLLITQYEVTASVSSASYTSGTGPLTVVDAGESEPPDCEGEHRQLLPKPLIIDPKAAGGVEIEPWSGSCDFRITVTGTTGQSNARFWTPNAERTIKMLREFNPKLAKQILERGETEFLNHLREQKVLTPELEPSNAVANRP